MEPKVYTPEEIKSLYTQYQAKAQQVVSNQALLDQAQREMAQVEGELIALFGPEYDKVIQAQAQQLAEFLASGGSA